MNFQGNLTDMSNLLVKMENEGVVDLAILPKIQELMAFLKTIQNQIISDTKAEAKANFLAYHIVRNINLTLEKMEFRFVHHKENHDNPIVADDSLALVPVIAESFNVAEKIINGELTYADERIIVEHIRNLRECMANRSMLVTSEEESKRVSQSGLQEEGKNLASAIKDIYTKQQQDSN